MYGLTISCVNMVPTASVWESREDMMAAKMPAASRPARTPPEFSRISWTMIGPANGCGWSMLPITPSATLGNQTTTMQSGYSTMVVLNDFAWSAESQWLKMCGKTPTDSGTKR